jgi:tetratricopeptide (TPR) repeat protein
MEGRTWTDKALALGGGADRFEALYGAAILAYVQGDHETAATRAQELVDAATAGADEAAIAKGHLALGLAAAQRGDRDAQAQHHAEALIRLRTLDEPSWLGLALDNNGEIALRRGDRAAARALFEEALTVYRAIGSEWGVALALFDLGDLALIEGDLTRAADLLSESAEISLRQRDVWRASTVMAAQVCELVEQGAWTHAALLAGTIERMREQAGLSSVPRIRADYETAITSIRTALGEQHFTELWAQGRESLPSQSAFQQPSARRHPERIIGGEP